ncbi:MAG: glycosyltransferase family 2 protein [Caulobacterales bacterium]
MDEGSPAQNAGSPRVGIVIGTFNANDHWPRLRTALLNQTFKDFEVVVIDNASDLDKRLADADLPVGFRHIQLTENIGYAAATNRAVATLQTEFIAMLNPDAFPEPEWLEQLMNAAGRHPGAAAFGSTQLRDDAFGVFDGIGDSYWAGGHPFRAGHGRSQKYLAAEGETFSVSAVAALFRRQAFLDIGGFDERFFAIWVDVDFGFRLRLAGGRAIQVPDAVVHHIGGLTIGRRSPFRTYHAFRNRLWIFVKNMPAAFFWFCLPGHIAMTAVDLFLLALRGAWKEAWLGLKHGWKDLPMIIETRREVQAKRRITLGALAKVVVWSPIDPFFKRPKVWATEEPELLPAR